MLEYGLLEQLEVYGRDASIVVRLEKVFKEELEIAERDASTCARRDQIFEQRRAVDATSIRRCVRSVRHAIFRERVSRRRDHQLAHLSANDVLQFQRVIRQTILVAGSCAEVVRPCELNRAQKVPAFDRREYAVGPREQSTHSYFMTALQRMRFNQKWPRQIS